MCLPPWSNRDGQIYKFFVAPFKPYNFKELQDSYLQGKKYDVFYEHNEMGKKLQNRVYKYL